MGHAHLHYVYGFFNEVTLNMGYSVEVGLHV